MPGDSPAVHQGCGILLCSSGAIFIGAPPILARRLPVPLVSLPVLCHSHGHSISRPSLAKVADFLTWLRLSRRLSISSIRGYRSMLSVVFHFHLPSLSSDPVLRDLLRSFKLSSAERVLRPPAWDLAKVLRYLNSSHFVPLSQASLRALSQKALFLLALATSKRVGELQALSSVVTFVGLDACLSYIPQFVAKTELLTRSIPRSFLVKS